MQSATTSLAIAQLILYIILLLPVLYIFKNHGRPGLSAWIFLTAFCLLRIIGSGLAIRNPASTSAQVISGVGLSPLVLSFSGVLNEIGQYAKGQKPFFTKFPVPIATHFGVMTAVALVVVGATTHQSGLKVLSKVGYIVFVQVFLGIAILTLLSWNRVYKGRSAKMLLLGLTISLPFLGIRILYSTIASFDTSINPYTGPIAYRIVLSVLMELAAVIILIIFGIITRHIESEGIQWDLVQDQEMISRSSREVST